ncbi:hypothetical protein GDO78_000077 [Eleutherodactylus coqui]|uniref:Secreted protein n=1 Tax=Eleutherodactylus coqui TaxID=57060 RepID=A0A8J6KFT7_ELECQ|nr:hypothetical protein GDO78_000077 [Eleutherodactylus coqui]
MQHQSSMPVKIFVAFFPTTIGVQSICTDVYLNSSSGHLFQTTKKSLGLNKVSCLQDRCKTKCIIVCFLLSYW